MPDSQNRFFPKQYTVDIEAGQNEGDMAADSVSLDNDFVLTGIRHQLIDDGSGSGNPPVQDGAYRLSWSIQTTTKFYKGSEPMADVAYGSVRHGEWIKLDAPLHIGENRTLEARVINTVNRTQKFSVQVLFAGLEHAPPTAQDKF